MNLSPGPDPAFPYLDEHTRYRFPDPLEADGDVIAVGGNLSPGMLLSAYEQGIFPWYNPEDPILWQSPDPRFVIFPRSLHVSRSMKKILDRGDFDIAVGGDFDGIIRGCAGIDRPGQGGTWITEDIIAGYRELFRLGYIQCAESRQNGALAGGCYGVLVRDAPSGNGLAERGGVFCGESMFASVSNASKAAFITLARRLFASGVRFIDCQVPSDHLRSLGGEELSRKEFLRLLRNAGDT